MCVLLIFAVDTCIHIPSNVISTYIVNTNKTRIKANHPQAYTITVFLLHIHICYSSHSPSIRQSPSVSVCRVNVPRKAPAGLEPPPGRVASSNSLPSCLT